VTREGIIQFIRRAPTLYDNPAHSRVLVAQRTIQTTNIGGVFVMAFHVAMSRLRGHKAVPCKIGNREIVSNDGPDQHQRKLMGRPSSL